MAEQRGLAERGLVERGLVLVHGAELGAWVWDDVLPLLRAPAAAVDLPGRGGGRAVRLADAVAAVAARAREADRPVVVALHSASGVLLPGLAAALGDRLVGAVLLGAAVAGPGRSWRDGQPLPVRLVLRVLSTVRPDGALSPAGDARRGLLHDLPAEAAERVLRQRVVEPPGWLRDPVAHPLPALPVTAVVLTADRAVPPERQRAAYRALPRARVVELPTGHLPMLADPAATAALLEAALRDPAPAAG